MRRGNEKILKKLIYMGFTGSYWGAANCSEMLKFGILEGDFQDLKKIVQLEINWVG
jgi:hypothetical protein